MSGEDAPSLALELPEAPRASGSPRKAKPPASPAPTLVESGWPESPIYPEGLAAVIRGYAEVDAATNAAITHLEETDEVSGFWRAISIGGPVEPSMPEGAWNGIMIVGKAPGDAEVAHGVPMSGPSGRLLDRMLERSGIRRAETVVTNAFRMQAPWTVDAEGKKRANDVSIFFTDDPAEGNQRIPALSGRYVRTGPDEHIRDLWRLVRRLRPKVVVALGEVAAWALTNEGGLKGRMGELLENACSAAPVIVTYNPAYAIHKRDEGVATLIAEHLAMAARHASGH